MSLSPLRRKLAVLDDAIAGRANAIFASMGFFWFCLVLTLLPLKWPVTMPFVQYASSGVLQLIALPLIGVGTILAARASDQLAKEQHDAAMETMQNVRAMLAEVQQLHIELHVKLDARAERETSVAADVEPDQGLVE